MEASKTEEYKIKAIAGLSVAGSVLQDVQRWISKLERLHSHNKNEPAVEVIKDLYLKVQNISVNLGGLQQILLHRIYEKGVQPARYAIGNKVCHPTKGLGKIIWSMSNCYRECYNIEMDSGEILTEVTGGLLEEFVHVPTDSLFKNGDKVKSMYGLAVVCEDISTSSHKRYIIKTNDGFLHECPEDCMYMSPEEVQNGG